MIISVSVVLRKTVGGSDWHFDGLSDGPAQRQEESLSRSSESEPQQISRAPAAVILSNSLSQDYTNCHLYSKYLFLIEKMFLIEKNTSVRTNNFDWKKGFMIEVKTFWSKNKVSW